MPFLPREEGQVYTWERFRGARSRLRCAPMTSAVASQPPGGFGFASPLAVVPLVMALVAIPVSLLAVLGLTAIADVSFHGTGAIAWMVADEKITS
jgi:hypothetical protein